MLLAILYWWCEADKKLQTLKQAYQNRAEKSTPKSTPVSLRESLLQVTEG
jgi:hypothetical protein